ncbi:MAG: transposase, partial [Dehalococcoidia bacterium]
TDDTLAPPRLPEELQQIQVLRDKVRVALDQLAVKKQRQVNLTDADAHLMKGRQGIMPAYNAQAVASPLTSGDGMLITAAEVADSATDYGQLIPMLEQAEETTGQRVDLTLADGGYHTAANLVSGEERGQRLVMPERYPKEAHGPYFKDQFRYDASTDSYLCPQGQRLPLSGIRRKNGQILGPFRVYRGSKPVCHKCPTYGICTKDRHARRILWIGPADELLRRHREWMTTETAKSLYSRRQGLIEPVFGILKEQLGARRFLLRGLARVQAEFSLLATAFNLRMLWRAAKTRRDAASLPEVIPQHA